MADFVIDPVLMAQSVSAHPANENKRRADLADEVLSIKKKTK